MPDSIWKDGIVEPTKERAMLIWALLLDFTYFVAWYLLQSVLGVFVSFLRPLPSRLDSFQLIVIQIAFAIATLIPIIAFTLKDVAIICIRQLRTVKAVLTENDAPAKVTSQVSTKAEGSSEG